MWMAGRTLRLEDSRTEARRERDGLFDTSDDLICAMDTEGLLILVSPSWTRLMGYEPGDLLGRPLSEFEAAFGAAAAREGLKVIVRPTE